MHLLLTQHLEESVGSGRELPAVRQAEGVLFLLLGAAGLPTLGILLGWAAAEQSHLLWLSCMAGHCQAPQCWQQAGLKSANTFNI